MSHDLRLRLEPRPSLNIRVAPRLTANIVESTGINVAYSGGTYTVSIDWASLEESSSIGASDIDNLLFAMYNEDTLAYTKTSVETLSTIIGASIVGADLIAIEALTGTGIATRIGENTWALATTSAAIAALLSDETGSGAMVFGTSPGFTTAANPVSNDGAALGTTALGWSDLHLATGALINVANGNAVVTHSSGIFTVSTGDWRVTTAGTNAASAVTVGGTQTLTAKSIDLTNNTLTGSVAEFNTALESADFYTTGGTDVALADGGTGTSLTDPNADRIMAWDDSAGVVKFMPLADLTDEAAPAAGDFLLIYGAEGDLRRTDWSELPSGSSGGVSPPQGRLTVATGTPVVTVTDAANTTVYYTPYIGNQVPIYDGSSYTMTSFTELSQTTTDNTKSPAAVANNSNYDIFVWDDAGTERATRGPAWTSDTGRGTGAGTTELEMVGGFLLNKIAITNGPAAQRGTYVGTIRSNGSAQIDWIFGAALTAGSFGVFNTYNRVDVGAEVRETANSWTYNVATWRSLNNSVLNRVSAIIGLSEDSVRAAVIGVVQPGAAANGGLSIGFDSTSTPSGIYNAVAASTFGGCCAELSHTPSIGWHFWQALENAGSANTATLFGDNGGTFMSTGMSLGLRL